VTSNPLSPTKFEKPDLTVRLFCICAWLNSLLWSASFSPGGGSALPGLHGQNRASCRPGKLAPPGVISRRLFTSFVNRFVTYSIVFIYT